MKGQIPGTEDIGAIIGIIFTLAVAGIVLNAIYNVSVQNTGPNSAASQTIGAEVNSFSLFNSIIIFLLDPIHDIELLVGVCTSVLGLLWYISKPR